MVLIMKTNKICVFAISILLFTTMMIAPLKPQASELSAQCGINEINEQQVLKQNNEIESDNIINIPVVIDKEYEGKLFSYSPSDTAKIKFSSKDNDKEIYFRLYDENMKLLDSKIGNPNFELTRVLKGETQYYLYAEYWNGETGSFNIIAKKTEIESLNYPSGSSVKIENEGETKWFSFTPSATSTLKFMTSGDTKVKNFRLYDKNLNKINWTFSSNININIPFTAGELYYFEIGYDLWKDTGDFNVWLERTSYSALTLGEYTRLTVSNAGDVGFFRFTPARTMIASFASFSPHDTYGYLYDAQMQLLAEDDNSGSGMNFIINYKLEAGKTYTLASHYHGTNSNRTGNYSVRVSEISFTPLDLAVSENAVIPNDGDTAWFSYTPDTAIEVDFISTEDNNDAVFGILYNENMEQIGYSDGNPNFSLTCNFEANKTYYLSAQYSILAKKGTFPVILSKNLSSGEFSAISPQDYTGTEITPPFTYTLNGTVLEKDKDYTVEYQDNINPGTATVKVTGIGEYTSENSTTFTINGLDLSTGEFSAISPRDYTGTEITPSFTYTLNGIVLEKDRDYTVEYENNINVGTATVKVTGVGEYTNENSTTFTINGQNLSLGTFSLISPQDYTGIEITPSFTYTLNGIALEKDRDYTTEYQNNINAGTATVKISGIGNYTNENLTTFTINGQNLSLGTFSLISPQDYTGAEITPPFTYTLNGTVLEKDKDYTVEYQNNINAGTATVKITGIGNYTSENSTTFTINGISLSTGEFSAISPQNYIGAEITPSFTYTLNGTVLEKDKDYTVEYQNNINAGTATVKITGIGNYTNENSTTFTIVRNNVDFTVTFNHNHNGQTVAKTIAEGMPLNNDFPNPPTRQGHDFIGWFSTSASSGGSEFTRTTPVTSSRTVWARWRIRRYTVTFRDGANNQILRNPSVMRNVNHNSTIRKPANPKKSGHTFVEWYTSRNYKTKFNFSKTRITQNTSVFARFVKNPASPKRLRKAKVTARSIRLNWNKVKGLQYQLQYSTNSKNWKNIKGNTVNRLKRNTNYRFRIRASRKVSGITVQSNWSKVIRIRTLK